MSNIRRATAFFVALTICAIAFAQSMTGGGRTLTSSSSGKQQPSKPGSCWELQYPLGEHIPAAIDTLTYNYQALSIPSFVSDAYATEGNIASPGIDMIYFGRRQRSDFFFSDAISHWIPTQYKQRFYNVFTPMTLLSYNFGGGRETRQDRLQATFAGNVNRRIGIGASVDYIHSKGAYENQAAKEFNFGAEGYYRGDRYEMQAFFNHYNHVNKENGGITDDLYITDPAQLQGGVSSIQSKSIPTRLSSAHSRVNGSQLFMNHAFNVGFWREEEVNDTLTRQVYVPVTKFIYTLNYRSAKHLFKNTSASEAADFWTNTYLNPSQTYDPTYYWGLSNTLGIAMIEGFNKWVPFGLSAYATFDTRHFRLPSDYQDAWGELTDNDGNSKVSPLPEGVPLTKRGSQNLLWIGTSLSSNRSKYFRFAANARFGITGDAAGDVDINGNIEGRIKLLGDTVSIKALGFFRNEAQPFLIKHYISNHFAWDNSSFGKTRSFRIGGEIHIPWTKTTLGIGVENVQNLVYFDSASIPRQNGGSVQVFAARLEQLLKFGIWNWNNRLTYQTSSDGNVIPLPSFALYSNMFIGFKAFHVLDLQIGVDCNYYTSYHGMNYQPATMVFTIGDGTKVGNFAFCNVYAMAKLYKVRFYVLLSHANQGLFSKAYFSMPHYPLNPRRLQFGLSVDFAN